MTRTAYCPADAKHLQPTAPDALKLEWTVFDGSRFRSDFSTCTMCNPYLIYEWGNLGGSFRIRRTDLLTGEAHVTPWVSVKEAAGWWLKLQNGTAI